MLFMCCFHCCIGMPSECHLSHKQTGIFKAFPDYNVLARVEHIRTISCVDRICYVSIYLILASLFEFCLDKINGDCKTSVAFVIFKAHLKSCARQHFYEKVTFVQEQNYVGTGEPTKVANFLKETQSLHHSFLFFALVQYLIIPTKGSITWNNQCKFEK